MKYIIFLAAFGLLQVTGAAAGAQPPDKTPDSSPLDRPTGEATGEEPPAISVDSGIDNAPWSRPTVEAAGVEPPKISVDSGIDEGTLGPVSGAALPDRVRLSDVLAAHSGPYYTLINDATIDKFTFRFKLVHVGGDINLMGNANLYRSSAPMSGGPIDDYDIGPPPDFDAPPPPSGPPAEILPSPSVVLPASSHDVPMVSGSPIPPKLPNEKPRQVEGAVPTVVKKKRFLDVSATSLEYLRQKYPALKHIVNLNEAAFSPESQSSLKRLEFTVTHIPIDDYETPTNTEIKSAVHAIEDARVKGSDTWIFCGYGDGRSGAMVAAYEVFKIQQAYPNLSITDVDKYLRSRSGAVDAFMRKNPTADYEARNNFVNSQNDHKIEFQSQFKAVEEYAALLVMEKVMDDTQSICIGE